MTLFNFNKSSEDTMANRLTETYEVSRNLKELNNELEEIFKELRDLKNPSDAMSKVGRIIQIVQDRHDFQEREKELAAPSRGDTWSVTFDVDGIEVQATGIVVTDKKVVTYHEGTFRILDRQTVNFIKKLEASTRYNEFFGVTDA